MKQTISKRVAVIEDDRDINELVCYNLHREGFLPTSIFDGSEAQETLQQEHFDIVVLDLMLPGIDGFSLCKYIKQRCDGYKTFVIILSAKTASTDKVLAHLLGADRYLTKPFSTAALMNIVNEVNALQGKDFDVQVDGSGPIVNKAKL